MSGQSSRDRGQGSAKIENLRWLSTNSVLVRHIGRYDARQQTCQKLPYQRNRYLRLIGNTCNHQLTSTAHHHNSFLQQQHHPLTPAPSLSLKSRNSCKGRKRSRIRSLSQKWCPLTILRPGCARRALSSAPGILRFSTRAE